MRDRFGPARTPGRLRLATRALLLGALLGLLAVTSSAELVVFSNGRVLRTESFEIVGERARMELESEGVVWVSMELIERVVDNEVELTPEERERAMAFGGVEERADSASTQSSADSPPGGTLFDDLDPTELDPARSISGKVLNELGEPVEGIEVRARSIRMFEGSPPADAASQIEASSRSDPHGLYRFDDLAEGEYGIRTLPTEYFTAAQTRVRTGSQGADLVLDGQRDVVVYGTVTDTQGEPLGEVAVSLGGSQRGAAMTSYDGRYALELPLAGRGRTYEIAFQREGYGDRILTLSDDQVLARSEVRLDASLELLESLAAVKGRVRSADGAPVPGERVFLVGEQEREAVSDGAGRFVISEVDGNQAYQLWISPRGPYRPYREEVLVGADGLEIEVVLEAERPETASLSGVMLDAAGNPVPNFSLWLRSADSSARQPIRVTGDASGLFAVRDVPLGRLTFTTVSDPRLTISGPDLTPEGAANVVLVLDAGGYVIRGRVLDGYGNPIAGLPVTLEWSHRALGGHSLSLRHGSADNGGFFSFSGLGPGPHVVNVAAPGFAPAQLVAEPGRDVVVELRGRSEGSGVEGGK